MARLIPSLILFLCLSLFLSSSHARSPVASPEDDAVDVPLPTADQQKDVSELESIILLPSDKLPESDRGSAAEINGDGEEKRVGDEKFPEEQPEKDEGEEEIPERANWRPMDRDLDRMREIRSRHGGPRFDGGDQVRPGRMPFWKERNDAVDESEHYHHHHHHHHGPHGEMFPGRWIDGPRFHPRFPDAEGEPMMNGEFKQPRFFFHRHHHRHHHHRHGGFGFYRGEERQERGFWSAVRGFFGRN